MCGRVSRPVRIFSLGIARAGRLWRAVPTCSIAVLGFPLVAARPRCGIRGVFLSSKYMKCYPEVIESYYLESDEGLFFAVKGLEHPPDRCIGVLRYAPDAEHGDRKKDEMRYRRLYHFAEQEDLLRSLYPQYLAYDAVFHATLQSVPQSRVRRVYDPRVRLLEMAAGAAASGIESDAVSFAGLLQESAGVPPSAIGISGSLLIGLHTEHSDLDFSVFGTENCRTIYEALGSLLRSDFADGPRRLEINAIKELYHQRETDTHVYFDKFVDVEKNKVCQGSFHRRPYFIRFIKEAHEWSPIYGSVRYTPLGRTKITAKIHDDQEAIFTPCKYVLSDVNVLEGPPLFVREIVSFRGRFCEQARTEQSVTAAGTLESVENIRGEIKYRLLLGSSPEDMMVPTDLDWHSCEPLP